MNVILATVLVLSASIHYNNLEAFAERLYYDPQVSCLTKANCERLLRVAKDPEWRKKAWKRMLKQELLWIPKEERLRIEQIARECEIPLKDEK